MQISLFNLYNKEATGLQDSRFNLWEEALLITNTLLQELNYVEETSMKEKNRISDYETFYNRLALLKENLAEIPGYPVSKQVIPAFNELVLSMKKTLTNKKHLKIGLVLNREIETIKKFCKKFDKLGEIFYYSREELFLTLVITYFGPEQPINIKITFCTRCFLYLLQFIKYLRKNFQ